MNNYRQRRAEQPVPLKRLIHVPPLKHDVVPDHIRFDSCTVQSAFMHVNNYEITISASNAESYLERMNEFVRDLRHAIDIARRIDKGDHKTRMWYENKPRLVFHIEKGIRKATDFGSWIREKDTEEHYLTLSAHDFVKGYEPVGIRHYISIEEHERLIYRAKIDIQDIIEKQVQRGISQAVEKNVETLTEAQRERQAIENQMAELEQRRQRLLEIEARHEEREREKLEQARLKAERAKTRNRAGYVYLLREINGVHFKIGRTSNPDNRIETFNVKLPFLVEYEHLIQTEDMYALESQLHNRFASKRVAGEFFALTPDDIAYIKGLTP